MVDREIEWRNKWACNSEEGPAVKSHPDLLKDKRISPGARMCLVWLRWLAAYGYLLDWSTSKIAEDMDFDVATVRSWLRELRAIGYLDDFKGTWVNRQGKGFVYFIQSENGGPIKIGYSEKPESRLKGLQTAYPVKLKILFCVNGDPFLETDLHNRFQHLRLQGEWFSPQPDLVEYIDLLMKRDGDV